MRAPLRITFVVVAVLGLAAACGDSPPPSGGLFGSGDAGGGGSAAAGAGGAGPGGAGPGGTGGGSAGSSSFLGGGGQAGNAAGAAGAAGQTGGKGGQTTGGQAGQTTGGQAGQATGGQAGQGGASMVCVPGQQIGCTCSNGAQGNQTCNATGTGFDACQCSSGTGGGGTGGAGGKGGTGGTSAKCSDISLNPAACDTCAKQKCCTSIVACLNQTECAAIYNCYKSCSSGDAACTNACENAHPSGVAAIGAIDSCLNTSCPSQCGGGTGGTGGTAGSGGSGGVVGCSTGTCSHGLCTQGDPLTPSCGACAKAVCAKDSVCCDVSIGGWDSVCVSEAKSICGCPCP